MRNDPDYIRTVQVMQAAQQQREISYIQEHISDWTIKVMLAPDGTIMRTIVRCKSNPPREKVVADRDTWTDTATLINVIYWANEVAQCHGLLTASNLDLSLKQ